MIPFLFSWTTLYKDSVTELKLVRTELFKGKKRVAYRILDTEKLTPGQVGPFW